MHDHPKTCIACSVKDYGDFRGNLSKAWEGTDLHLSASEVLHKTMLKYFWGIGAGVSYIEWFLCNMWAWVQILSTNVKTRLHVPLTLGLGSGDRWILGPCWPASLVKSSLPVQWKILSQGNKSNRGHLASSSDLQMHLNVCVHTIHTNIHIHICVYAHMPHT